MKKTILILLSVLFVLGVTLSLLDQKSEYGAEHDFWKLNKRFKAAAKDPEVLPENVLNQLKKDYQAFINTHQGAKLTPLAQIFLGRVYILNKEYPAGRKIYESVIQKYPDNPVMGLQATIDIGKTYEMEKDDANILSTYDRILKNYAISDFGLKVPLLITKFYADKNDATNTQQSFEKAIIHYDTLIAKYPNTIVEFHALRLKATCFIAQKKWEEALSLYTSILNKFSDPRLMQDRTLGYLIQSINMLCVGKLSDPDKAIAIYQNFIETHPQHPLNKPFKQMIKRLKDYKTVKRSTEKPL